MPTPYEDFLARFDRYEAAVKKVYQDNDGCVDAFNELRAARQSLSEISRRAKAAFDEKFVPAEGDRLFGKVLKDWATALMRNHGWVRSTARAAVLEHITAIKNVEESKAFLLMGSMHPLTDKEETDRVRCEAGGPLPLDHLPEGSH